MDQVIINSVKIFEDESHIKVCKCLLNFQATQVEKVIEKIDELGGSGKMSLEKVSNDPELKEIMKHLKYVFLGENPLQPTIISSTFSFMEEEKRFRVL